MNSPGPYLTKSRYIDGLRCPRKLWFDAYDPLPRHNPDPFSPLDVGIRVGKGAHQLFPGGVEVEEAPWKHDEAVQTTKTLIEDSDVPAIFEAAFDYRNIRIRIDVLERRLGNSWGIREVKSSTGFKKEKFHLEDVAVQLYVTRGAGLNITSLELIHINSDYVRGYGDIEWSSFFHRFELTKEANAYLGAVADHIPQLLKVLNTAVPPDVYPTKGRCHNPYRCDYWDRCISDKPNDWIACLPRVNRKKLMQLNLQGIESIRKIPVGFKLSDRQLFVRDVVASGIPHISSDLNEGLKECGPPTYYMDFETMNPGIPVYPGTKPYKEHIPFQWSLHLVDEDQTLHHWDFLSEGSIDPRREFAESLIRAVKLPNIPILVYNASTEIGILKALAQMFPDLANNLSRITANVVDLLAILRKQVCYPEFFTKKSLNSGAYSIKNILPVLVPAMSYEGLEGVAEGQKASQVFTGTVCDAYSPEEVQKLRRKLLIYCEQDTLAMVEVHRHLSAIESRY